MYLVQRRIDMLPKPLTEDICSLRADVERLAFSVLWEVTPDAQVRGRPRGGRGALVRGSACERSALHARIGAGLAHAGLWSWRPGSSQHHLRHPAPGPQSP